MSNQEVVHLLLEQLDDQEIIVRNMFGGEGIFRKGLMFGLVYDGVLYMKMSQDAPAISDRPPFRARTGRIPESPSGYGSRPERCRENRRSFEDRAASRGRHGEVIATESWLNVR